MERVGRIKYREQELQYLTTATVSGAVLVLRRYSLCVAASLLVSRRTGLTEKNLCRHGAQRSAGRPKIRPTIDTVPGTWCGEMRSSSRFPQIRQCA